MGKKVAIGIQVYNEARFLRATLESVLAQTFGDFEVIVSDNHSTDGTADIVREFQARDPRVTLWQPPTFCKSLEHARWLLDGINALDHESSIFIGGHDLIMPRYVERLVAGLDAHPGAAMVVGHGIEIDMESRPIQAWPQVPQVIGGMVPFRPLVVLMALNYNIAAFSLWPARTRRAVKLRHDCIGADHLMIAEGSLLGDIVVVPEAVIQTRRIEGSGSYGVYFKKHISDDFAAANIVANFNLQIEWLQHLNELAFGNFPESMRRINLASALGCYFARYGVSQLSAVEGALGLWLNSEAGVQVASHLSQIGAGIEQRVHAARAQAALPAAPQPLQHAAVA